MTRDRKVLYTASLLLVAVLLGVLFVPRSMIRSIAAAISAAAAVAIYFAIKKRSILSINKKQVLLLMSVMGVLYVVIYYLTGIGFGFYRSLTPFSVPNFFKYVLPIAVIIVSIEVIRSVFLAQKNKLSTVCAYVIGIMSELAIGAGLAGNFTFNRFMDIVGMILLPAAVSNLLYHYLSAHYGAYPNIVYRLITALYMYVIPVRPSTPDSLVAFASLFVPLVIYVFIKALYANKYIGREPRSRRYRWVGYLSFGATVAFMISLVMLISCQFRYGALVIATESMTGEINKGDAVVYEEYDGQLIKEDQVIIYRNGESLVVHRVDGMENINGVTRYYTKGDANEERDDGYITAGNIEGVVLFKVSYVGYPSIWMRNIFK